MARPLDLVNDAVVNAMGIVPMRNTYGHVINKVPTTGLNDFTLTATKTGAGAATVLLKGTNNPDPADTNGETLATLTHGGADQQDGSAAAKGYKFVFVHVTALAAGSFAAAGGFRLGSASPEQ